MLINYTNNCWCIYKAVVLRHDRMHHSEWRRTYWRSLHSFLLGRRASNPVLCVTMHALYPISSLCAIYSIFFFRYIPILISLSPVFYLLQSYAETRSSKSFRVCCRIERTESSRSAADLASSHNLQMDSADAGVDWKGFIVASTRLLAPERSQGQRRWSRSEKDSTM